MAGVMIVDDASFMRRVIRKIIESDGHEVAGEATDGTDAIEKYEALRPDLVTMDIVMPRCSGINALQEIILRHPDARIVMCSALGEPMMCEPPRNSPKYAHATPPRDHTHRGWTKKQINK